MAEATHWLYTGSWAGRFAYPVVLLSQGAHFARVRLLHKTHVGKRWYPAGTIKHRVPLGSLSQHPPSLAMRSLGGGRFEGGATLRERGRR